MTIQIYFLHHFASQNLRNEDQEIAEKICSCISLIGLYTKKTSKLTGRLS